MESTNTLTVKFVGFGGGFMEYPCYKDENEKLYFDINDGKNGLDLYTGAYMDELRDICGEPNQSVMQEIKCDKPFSRNLRERDYQFLSRLKADCEYFLRNGNGCKKYLYKESIEKHCDEMEKIWNSFTDEQKPKWLTMEQIKDFRKKMLNTRK